MHRHLFGAVLVCEEDNVRGSAVDLLEQEDQFVCRARLDELTRFGCLAAAI